MDAKQLKELIERVLRKANLYSEAAVDLLMLTAAQESACGKYIRQLGNGPALGIFQMEPATLTDIYVNYLKYKKSLAAKVERFATGCANTEDLHGNLMYQIIMARVHYLRVPAAIPSKVGRAEYDYIDALAGYWKKYYNTSLGKGTIREAVANYDKYVRRNA